MRYKKPPVLEAWIRFQPDLSDEKEPMERERAISFLMGNYTQEDFDIDKVGFHYEVRLDPSSTVSRGGINIPSPDPKFLLLRVFSKDREKCLQVGRDVLIFNLRNEHNSWKGYKELKDNAFQALSRYMDFRGIEQIRSMSIHYLDKISIPQVEGQPLEIREFLNVYPNVPQQMFGATSDFRLDIHLPKYFEQGNTHVKMKSLPVSAEISNYEILIQWQISTIFESGSSLDTAGQWVDAAHTTLGKLFEEVLTEKCKNIFEPMEDK